MYPNWKEITKRKCSKQEINYGTFKEKDAGYKKKIESKINNIKNITWDSPKDILKQSTIETVGIRKR